MCVAFANGGVALLSREGLYLTDIAQHDSPVGELSVHPGGTHVAVACKNGLLAVHQLTFATVHALYRDYYAFRYETGSLPCVQYSQHYIDMFLFALILLSWNIGCPLDLPSLCAEIR